MFTAKPASFGTACSQVFPLNISSTDKAAIVNYHNTLRRQVAKGQELRGTPGPQPTASNMREIVRSPDVKIANCILIVRLNRLGTTSWL